MMRSLAVLVAFIAAAPLASAQQPDTTARSDSVARADSLARMDSLVRREVERIRREARPVQAVGAARRADTSSAASDLLSSLAVVGDMIADLSPEGSTLESARRFELRELHLAAGARIASRLRGDFIVGVDDESRVMIMEALLSTTSLPWGLRASGGRFQAPFGEVNATHRVRLPTIEYPYVIQRFLGPHGGRATGVTVAQTVDWLGFRSELLLTALERFPEGHEVSGEHAAQGHLTFEPRAAEPANKTLQGLGYTGRLSTTWHVDQPFSIETSISAGTLVQMKASIGGRGSHEH